MQHLDVTGKPLPTIIVSGYRIYPPDLRTVKAVSNLGVVLQSCIDDSVNAYQLENLYDTLSHILGFNEENKDFTRKELMRQPFEDVLNVIAEYARFLDAVRAAHPVPQIYNIEEPEEEDIGFSRVLSEEKLVADFANLSLPEVNSLGYVDFLILRREAILYNLSQTREGREQLRDAYCFEQTAPDRESLRDFFGGDTIGVR